MKKRYFPNKAKVIELLSSNPAVDSWEFFTDEGVDNYLYFEKISVWVKGGFLCLGDCISFIATTLTEIKNDLKTIEVKNE